MPLSLRSLFRRREPIDLMASDRMEPEQGRTAAATIEAKPVPPRVRSLAEMQRTHDEVMMLVRKISDHLDDQASRHERLQEVLERLPGALEVLPEINRQNARLLDILTENLDQARRRENGLGETLARISESAGRQTEVLGLLREQLDVTNHSAGHISEVLGEFQSTLGALAQSNARTVDVLSGMAVEAQRREVTLERAMGRWQRWMIAALCVSGGASVAALAYGLLS
jgi:chromosome segregation ATPase